MRGLGKTLLCFFKLKKAQQNLVCYEFLIIMITLVKLSSKITFWAIFLKRISDVVGGRGTCDQFSYFCIKFYFSSLNVTFCVFDHHFNKIRPKTKICVFTVTRPTLIFASDPINFYTEFG